MKRITWVFWGFLAVLTGLWLMADTLLPAQRGYFDFRTVWVQYTGVIAMGVMSLAMAAGGAPGVAGAAPGRPGQDVPPAQVAGHWRAGGGHGALAVSQGHQVGRGLGLADQAGARCGRRRGGVGRHRSRAARLARHGRDDGRMGLLRRRAADRAGARQALPLPPLRQDAQAAGRGLPGAGVPHRCADQDRLLGTAGGLGAGGAAGGGHGVGGDRAAGPHRCAAHRARHHRVAGALSHPALLETTLLLDERWAGHQPGQFAFLTSSAAEGAHPYTIASAWNPQDRRVSFVTKALGDHTGTLHERLRVGDRVKIEGPYGHFTFEGDAPQQIWIGAGIGITPFIARMKHLAQAGARGPTVVDLFHPTAAIDPAALQKLQANARAAGVRLHLLVDGQDERLTGERLRQMVPGWKNASVWFCGPAGFGQALRADLTAQGLPDDAFHQELFQMR